MRKFFLLLTLLTLTTAFSQTVYITKTGEKYHKQTCGHLRKSSISIELSEAIERGYEACMTCKPASGTKKTSTLTVQSFYNSSSQTSTSSSSSSSVQCSGRTKAGKRCQRMTKDSSGRCYQH